MKIKVIYPKNLGMSEGKAAAQVAHAVRRLSLGVFYDTDNYDDTIIVLKVSQTKFNNTITDLLDENIPIFIQTDSGYTEVPAGTKTAVAWVVD